MTEPRYPGDCEFIAALQARAREKDAATGKALQRARQIRLLLLDVDGVLTDGSLIYLDDGRECKVFNSRDGFGLTLLHKAGIQTGIITARTGGAVAHRARQLGMTHLAQGVRDKAAALANILVQTGLDARQIAYMGDDWLDLPVLRQVGLAVAVADAVAEVRQAAHYITQAPGGRGAVREVCELILEAQDKRQDLLAAFLGCTGG